MALPLTNKIEVLELIIKKFSNAHSTILNQNQSGGTKLHSNMNINAFIPFYWVLG